jgi:methylmalonyl-CoA epimerase
MVATTAAAAQRRETRMGLTAKNPFEEAEELKGEESQPGAPGASVDVIGLDHIAVAVADLGGALEQYRTVFGLTVETREVVADEGVEVAVLRLGDVALHLVSPVDDDADLAAFLEEWGPGLHHLGLRVADASDAVAVMEREGYDVVDQVTHPGVAGTRVAYVNPHDIDGTIIQVVEGT